MLNNAINYWAHKGLIEFLDADIFHSSSPVLSRICVVSCIAENRDQEPDVSQEDAEGAQHRHILQHRHGEYTSGNVSDVSYAQMPPFRKFQLEKTSGKMKQCL